MVALLITDWSGFYLFCFAFGFLFSLIAFASGHLHFHDSGGHGEPGHSGAAADAQQPECGPSHTPVTGGAHHLHPGSHHHPASMSGRDATRTRPAVSPFNAGTIAVFFAWFGGTGYLGTRFTALWVYATLGLALLSGLFGAWLIYVFLTRVLLREREELDAADFCLIGMLGEVTGSIRAGGLGEILYSQAGARRAVPARGEDPAASIPGGTEVIVTRYENGIAYVRRWEEFLGNGSSSPKGT